MTIVEREIEKEPPPSLPKKRVCETCVCVCVKKKRKKKNVKKFIHHNYSHDDTGRAIGGIEIPFSQSTH